MLAALVATMWVVVAPAAPVAADEAPPVFDLKWGTYGVGGGGQFNSPRGVAVDSSGNVYVADYANSRVQKFNATGAFVSMLGTEGTGNGQFQLPNGVAVDSSGNVYVTDEQLHRVQKFNSTGAFVTQWGTEGIGNGQFLFPSGVAVDSVGNVYVADTDNHRIQKFTSNGAFVTKWGTEGSGDGQFGYPAGVAVDASGNVYVTDASNARVQKFTATGTFVTKWGTAGTGNGQFDNAYGVAVDSSGNVYVTDSGEFDYEWNPDGHRVQMFTSAGAFVTKWGTVGGGDGQFWMPRGVAVDSSGNVYVAEEANNRVQRFRPADVVDPSVDLRVPAAGAVFVVGAVVAADFSCDDTGGSGLDTCVGTVANGAAIDTSTGGEHTFTVTATDRDGNETVVTHTYVVSDPVPGVSGTVTSSGSGAPVGGAWVAVLRSSDFSVEAGAVADGSGNFSVAVAPGSYFLFLVDPSGAHTAGFGDAPSMVTVSATATAKTEADTQMVSLRGSLAGTVTEAGSGDPIGGAWALSLSGAIESTGALELLSTADGAGVFSLPGLRAGNHYLAAVDPSGGHETRFFPDSPNVPDASQVAVTAGNVTPVDMALPAQAVAGTGAVVSGTVTEEGTGDPLSGVRVVALRASDFAMVRGATTNGSGVYSLDVPAGGYKLAIFDSAGLHTMEWFDDLPSTDLAGAVTVTAPGVADAALGASTGTLTGGVLNDPADDPAEGPVAGAWVVAIGPNGIAGGAVTRSDGIYEITGLAPGTYRATIVDPNGGRTQEYFDGAADYDAATPLNIVAGATTYAGANLSMAPLTNDDLADAEEITGATGGVSGSTARATTEPGEPHHASNAGGGSIWYRWTAPANGRAHFTTCGSGFDTLLAAYTGTEVNNLAVGAQNDNALLDRCGDNSAQSWAWFPATAGVTYHIAVDGHDNARGRVILGWSLERAPNDDFVDAQVLTGATGTASGSTRLASKEPGEPDHAFKLGEASIWYRWTAPSNGTVTFTTCGSTFDTLLAAYTGPAVDDLTYVSSNDDSTCPAHIQRSVMAFAATAGVTYQIAVDGYRDARGDVTLNWSMT